MNGEDHLNNQFLANCENTFIFKTRFRQPQNLLKTHLIYAKTSHFLRCIAPTDSLDIFHIQVPALQWLSFAEL